MTNNHIERTKRMIEVMQAYVDGERVEYKRGCLPDWRPVEDGYVSGMPAWNWPQVDYRIAKTEDSINWDHVAPEFKYMARDASGVAYVYEYKPYVYGDSWQSSEDVASVRHLASYKRGTVYWKDSLVIRPGCE